MQCRCTPCRLLIIHGYIHYIIPISIRVVQGHRIPQCQHVFILIVQQCSIMLCLHLLSFSHTALQHVSTPEYYCMVSIEQLFCYSGIGFFLLSLFQPDIRFLRPAVTSHGGNGGPTRPQYDNTTTPKTDPANEQLHGQYHYFCSPHPSLYR